MKYYSRKALEIISKNRKFFFIWIVVGSIFVSYGILDFMEGSAPSGIIKVLLGVTAFPLVLLYFLGIKDID